MLTYVDGRFVPDSEATISVRSRGLNYGVGCFAGVRGYLADDGQQVFVFRLDDHVRRLELSAKLLFLRCEPFAQARQAVIDLLRKNEVHFDVYLRPMVISNSTELSPVLREQDSSFIVYCLPLKRYIDKESIDVCISSWRRTSDNAIPSRAKPTGGYLNSALARREAFDNGFDEAILLTEAGMVSEGSAEHVFIVRDGTLLSPPSTEHNLDGITRRTLLQLAREDLPYRHLFTSIWTWHDNIVAPQTSSRLAGARNVAFGGIGHVALGSDPRVLCRVLDEVLAAGALTQATPPATMS
jgi:branched-chain amino acid aminotransferase